MQNNYDVIIIGSGLAGLSAGVELSLQHKKVLILEARAEVGGRTSSWIENNMKVESGLHRYLGFYTAFPKLIRKAGLKMDDIIVWEDEVEIRLPDGGPYATFGLAPLFRPFTTIQKIIGNTHFLTWKEKFQFIRFFIAGIKDYFVEGEKLDQLTVAQYAKKKNIDASVIEKVIIPLTTGIFFLTPEQYSAYPFFGLFAQGVKRFYKMRIGAFKGGMTEVLANPLAAFIGKSGGEVRLNTPVREVITEDDKVVGVKTDKEIIRAKAVICATTLSGAQSIVWNSGLDKKDFEGLMSLSSMPAVTVQFELEEPSMQVDHTTFGPRTYLCSFAEQSRTTFTDVKGRLSMIMAQPEKFIDMSEQEIIGFAKIDAKRLGLNISHILNTAVTYLPSDFYSLIPGNEKKRPYQRTKVQGFYLAGDYTKQPYFATMEGAIISGKLAAEAYMQDLSM